MGQTGWPRGPPLHGPARRVTDRLTPKVRRHGPLKEELGQQGDVRAAIRIRSSKACAEPRIWSRNALREGVYAAERRAGNARPTPCKGVRELRLVVPDPHARAI